MRLSFFPSCLHRLSQSLTRTETVSSAKTTLGTCWPQWVRSLCLVSLVSFVKLLISMNVCSPSKHLSVGQLNVKNEELEAMIKEASGPINFTVFLTMFGEKLKGMQKSVFSSIFQSLLYSVSVTHFRCLWKVLIPKTSLCLPSRSWTQRALASSRSNCKLILSHSSLPRAKKLMFPCLTAIRFLRLQPWGASDHSVRQVLRRGGEITCCSS